MSKVVSLAGAAMPRRSAPRGHGRPIDKRLLRIDPWVMVWKLAVFAGLLVLGGAGILSGHLAAAILGTVLVGAMYAHGVELTHQLLHGSGFKGRAANRVAGVLCAFPMLVAHSHYRALHLAHHRDIGTPANTEFFHYGNVKGRPFLIVLARSFSLGRYLGVARELLGALTGRPARGATGEQERRAIRIEYLAMLVAILGVVAFTAVTRSDLAIRLWLIPLLVVAEPIHFWVELPEHFGCDLTTRNVLLNTRTIRGSWLSFWFTNGNNLHVEHHLYPRVAIDKLPRVHATIHGELRFYNPSYWSFLGTVLSRETAEPGSLAGDAPMMVVDDTGPEDLVAAAPARAESPAAAPVEPAAEVVEPQRGSRPSMAPGRLVTRSGRLAAQVPHDAA